MSPCTPRTASAHRALSRQGYAELRWATFEAAKCAARRGSPDYPYYQRLAARPDSGKNPTLAVERKILRRSYRTPRELGDAALGTPVPEAKEVAAYMRCARALPIHQLMPAASSRNPPAATRCLGGRPGKNERPPVSSLPL